MLRKITFDEFEKYEDGTDRTKDDLSKCKTNV